MNILATLLTVILQLTVNQVKADFDSLYQRAYKNASTEQVEVSVPAKSSLNNLKVELGHKFNAEINVSQKNKSKYSNGEKSFTQKTDCKPTKDIRFWVEGVDFWNVNSLRDRRYEPGVWVARLSVAKYLQNFRDEFLRIADSIPDDSNYEKKVLGLYVWVYNNIDGDLMECFPGAEEFKGWAKKGYTEHRKTNAIDPEAKAPITDNSYIKPLWEK